MRIAIVHSFYRSALPSGENRVVEHQVRGLAKRGHDVLLVRADSDHLSTGRGALVGTAARVALHRGRDPGPELRRFRPDVVHVHNLFPNFGYGWLETWCGPIAATVHNYRSVCSAGVLARDGELCTLCPDGDRWASVRYRCYRGSTAATLPMAWRTRHGVQGDPLLRRADRVIVLSQYTRRMFARFGLARERMVLVPNGVPDPGFPGMSRLDPPRFVAVGRLSSEKGFRRLMRDWPAGVGLDVVGGGPDEVELRREAPPGVEFRGLLSHRQLLEEMGKYSGLIMPGANPEGGIPIVAAEALGVGVPLVARKGGVLTSVVDRWPAGAAFTTGNDLVAALGKVLAMAATEVRSVYERRFTQDRWLAELESLYGTLIAGAQGDAPRLSG